MTLSLAAVFIPVLFMGGVVGRLLTSFAVVITVAVLVSGFVSADPHADAVQPVPRPPGESHGRLFQASERFFDGMLRTVRPLAEVDARPPAADDGGDAADLRLTAWLFQRMPKGFIRPRTPVRSSRSRRPRRTSRSKRWREAAGRRRDAGSSRTSTAHVVHRRLDHQRSSRTPAASSCASSAIERPPPTRSSTDLRPKLAAIPGSGSYPQNLPTIASAATHQGALPVHAPGGPT